MDFLTAQVGPETRFQERQFAIGLGPWAETRFLYPRESAQKPGFSQVSSSGVSHLGQKPGISTPQVGPETRFQERQFISCLRSGAETRFLYPASRTRRGWDLIEYQQFYPDELCKYLFQIR